MTEFMNCNEMSSKSNQQSLSSSLIQDEGSQFTFEGLPTEMKELVFLQLDIFSIGVVLRVNKTWNKLIESHFFWKFL